MFNVSGGAHELVTDSREVEGEDDRKRLEVKSGARRQQDTGDSESE